MPANFPILGVSSPYFLAKKHKKQTQPTQNARTISQISRKPTKMSHKQKSLQYHVNHQTSPNQPIFPPNSSCPFVATWPYWVRSALLYWQFYGWSIPHCPCTCWHEVPGFPPRGDPGWPGKGFFWARSLFHRGEKFPSRCWMCIVAVCCFLLARKKHQRNPTKSKFGKNVSMMLPSASIEIIFLTFLGSHWITAHLVVRPIALKPWLWYDMIKRNPAKQLTLLTLMISQVLHIPWDFHLPTPLFCHVSSIKGVFHCHSPYPKVSVDPSLCYHTHIIYISLFHP